MRDFQDLVDAMQGVIASPDEWSQDEVQELAKEYAEQCRAVNKRLGDCHKLLRQGQITEAVRQAELEPRLIEWAGALDFGDRGRWEAFCELMGLTVPPPLARERIKALHEAYSISPDHDALLRSWRYQNLARVPLNQRMETLLRLAQMDEGNLIWQEDLRAFEEAWLKEVNDHIAGAVREGDLSRLHQLRSSIEERQYPASLIKPILERLDRAILKLERKQGEVELQESLDLLEKAYSLGHVEEVGYALERLDAAAMKLNLDRNDPRIVAAEPAREWLIQRQREIEQERRAAEARTTLEMELDHPTSVEVLSKLYHTAAAGGRPLPLELERQYRLVTNRLLEVRRHGHQLRIAIAAAVAVVALAAVAVAGWLMMRSQERERVIQSLSEFTKNQKFAEADRYLERLQEEHPNLFENPAIQAALADLNVAKEKESKRKQEFQDLARRLENALDDGNPSRDDLNRLKALAQGNEERLQAESIAGRAEERWRELDRLRREDWEGRRIAARHEIERLEAKDVALIKPNEIEAVETKVHELMRDSTVPEELSSSTKALLARVQEIKSARQRWERDMQQVKPLTLAMGRHGAFEATLREMARDSQNPHAAVCDKLANVLPWNAVDEWNNLADRWNDNRETLDPQKAKNIVADINRNQYPVVEDGGWKQFVASEWRPYMDSLARRDEKALKQILVSWQKPFISQTFRIHVFDDTGERIIYSLEDPRPKTSAGTFGISAVIADGGSGSDPFSDELLQETLTLSELKVLPDESP